MSKKNDDLIIEALKRELSYAQAELLKKRLALHAIAVWPDAGEQATIHHIREYAEGVLNQ